MDWQLLLNLNLYHCMRPCSDLQDVLGNGLARSVLVSVCLCGGSLNVCARYKTSGHQEIQLEFKGVSSGFRMLLFACEFLGARMTGSQNQMWSERAHVRACVGGWVRVCVTHLKPWCLFEYSGMYLGQDGI
jgi:hypothetical protein